MSYGGMYQGGSAGGTIGPKSTDVRGVSMIERQCSEAHNVASSIMERLLQLEARIYSPRPQPVGSDTSATIPASVENSLNALLSRLHEIDNKAGELLG